MASVPQPITDKEEFRTRNNSESQSDFDCYSVDSYKSDKSSSSMVGLVVKLSGYKPKGQSLII